jgi:hypothetical protein
LENLFESKPGQDCTLEDLRWFCIREIDKVRRDTAKKNLRDYQVRLDMDVLKAQGSSKVEMTYVENKTQGVSGLVEQVAGELNKHKAETENNLDKVMHMLKTAEADTTDRLNKLNLDEMDKKFAMLQTELNKFASDTQQTFQQVEGVETGFHAHVGQAFNELGEEVKKIKEEMSSPNSRNFPGATNAPAGAHDGIPSSSSKIQGDGSNCHCHHVGTLWGEYLKGEGNKDKEKKEREEDEGEGGGEEGRDREREEKRK